jgi:hypothetical protein
MADLLGRLSRSWQRHRVASAPVTRRLFRCRCGRPLFFRNSRCLGCGAEVGYDPDQSTLLALPDDQTAPYRIARTHGRVKQSEARYVRCANYAAIGCNWLLDVTEASDALTLCRSCRLTRTVPDLGIADNARYWARIEDAKRQVVSTLITLGLPVCSRVSEDPQSGLAFDLLRSPPGGPRIVTGHASGVITIDAEEADDATREQRRAQMHEPYRTLVGHLRHEIGHYYWYRLMHGAKLIAEFRALFGEEGANYADALRRHYETGPPHDWPVRFVSAYASAHPWEDWAETWAHYLHMIDSLDTALSFGVSARAVDANFERFGPDALSNQATAGRAAPTAASTAFLAFVNAWVELATALNELSRTMGQPDFYPFVLSRAAVRKLHFVHRIVNDRSVRRAHLAAAAHRPGTDVAAGAH